jgi:tetratricopeptide (TPR) repeat protein
MVGGRKRAAILTGAVLAIVLGALAAVISITALQRRTKLLQMSTADVAAWSAQHPDDLEARQMLGSRLARDGRTDEAVRFFEEEARANPSAVWPLVAESRVCLQAGRLDAARAPIDEALRRDRTDADVLTAYAEVLSAGGSPDAAEETLRGVLARGGRHPAAQADLAKILADKGDFAGARGALEQAVADAPSDPRTQFSVGYVEFKAGNVATAVSALSRAAESEPNRGETWALLAAALVRSAKTTADITAASQALDRAESLLPGMSGVPYYRGLLLAKQRRYADAAVQFRRALDLDPKALHVLYNLATSLSLSGQAAESAKVRAQFKAARDYERVMIQLRMRATREPERLEIWRQLEKLAVQHGDVETARFAREHIDTPSAAPRDSQ